MVEFSRSSVLRRWYFLCLGLALAALLILRLGPLAPNKVAGKNIESIASITDNLIAGTLTSLIIGAAYVLLFPTSERSQFEIVRSRDIAQIIEEECHGARQWSVRSRAANYFTTVTLSTLIQDALATGRPNVIRVQTINPEDQNLLTGYAHSMQDIQSRVATWSVDRAWTEVYASILRAAIKCRAAPRVELQFGLSSALWVTSLDFSDRVALVACQNKGTDALLFRSDSEFYSSYVDDFNAAWQLCRIIHPSIDFDVPTQPEKLTNPVCDSLRGFFMSLELREPTDEQLKVILKTLAREHDYA